MFHALHKQKNNTQFTWLHDDIGKIISKPELRWKGIKCNFVKEKNQ